MFNVYIKGFVFFILLLWCAGVFAEFIIPLKGPWAVAIPFLNIAYSNVCHQISEKEISYGAFHSLVCSRCCGIYVGGLTASFIALFRKRNNKTQDYSKLDDKLLNKKYPESRYLNIRLLNYILSNKLLLLIILPPLADVVLYNTGVYHYSKNIAFFTGFLSGSAGFFYILDAFLNFIDELNRKRVSY